MTNEEAIADIRDNIKPIVGGKSLDMAIKALEKESCEDAISREAIKQKLQGHHDFFVSAYGSFKDMPFTDKARVDEISSCIAMVVNEPSVTPQPKTGKWMLCDNQRQEDINNGNYMYTCTNCLRSDVHAKTQKVPYCWWCGAKMEVEE